MITAMTKYNFILLAGEQNSFLEQLGELGVVDITRSSKPVDSRSEEILAEVDKIKSAINLLSAVSGEPSDYFSSDPVADARRLSSLISDLKSELDALKSEREKRSPWGSFDKARLAELESEGVYLRYYALPSKSFKENPSVIKISNDGKNVFFVSVSADPDFRFCNNELAAPEGPASELDKDIAGTEASLAAAKADLAALKSQIPMLEKKSADLLCSLDLYLAGQASSKAAEGLITVFTGFAPSEFDSKLKTALDKMNIYWSCEAAKVSDQPPVELKNNKFTAMFKTFTDMYGRPAYDGFDPTPFLSIFFMLFFAFCMGDMGYGLVLVIAGFLLKKVKSFAGFAPLVVTLGAATTVIGFLFHTFFSIDISTWECLSSFKGIMLPGKIAGFDGTMVLSIVVGIVHLCLAMITKAIVATKNNGLLESLGTWGWTTFIVGGFTLAALGIAGLNVKLAAIILASVSGICIFLLNNIHRNPLLNIGSGLWEAYNTATGLLGDVLSYLRLYALGLAGGMLGLAFNNLGLMVLGDGSFGLNWLFFGLVVLIGHTLNIAMAALGAFVHPLRLNFLEFFKNSGYEASGRNYNPLIKNQ